VSTHVHLHTATAPTAYACTQLTKASIPHRTHAQQQQQPTPTHDHILQHHFAAPGPTRPRRHSPLHRISSHDGVAFARSNQRRAGGEPGAQRALQVAASERGNVGNRPRKLRAQKRKSVSVALMQLNLWTPLVLLASSYLAGCLSCMQRHPCHTAQPHASYSCFIRFHHSSHLCHRSCTTRCVQHPEPLLA
jgi:hypothetical protein